MEETLKNRIILILAILTVIFLIGTLSSCISAQRSKAAFNKEMVARLDMEEKIARFTQEKTAIEAKIKEVTQALEAERAALETTKKALLQEQLIGKSLREELQKVTKLKETLEEDLKEALVRNKSVKPKQ